MTARSTAARMRRTATALSGAVAVCACAAAVLFAQRADDKTAQLDAVTASTAAACSYTGALADFDYTTGLDALFETMSAGATGDYAAEVAASRDDIKAAMIGAEMKSRGELVRCGWVLGTTDTATVLAAVTQFRSGKDQPVEQRSDVTIELSLSRSEDGRWLVNRMDSPVLQGNPVPAAPSAAPAPQPEPEAAAPTTGR